MNAATCALRIANIAVAITCADQAIVAALRQRYAHFAAHGPTALLITVTLDAATRTLPLFDPPISFTGDQVQIDAPGYHALLDLARGTAHVRLASAHPIEEIEYCVRVAYALLALRAGGLLFHAAAIVRDDRAAVFFGASGSGKTTVARVSSGDLILNDDLVLIMPAADGWMVHATPFSNPTQVAPARASSAPLGALFRLVQSKQVYATPLCGGHAIAELLASCPVVSADPHASLRLITRVQQLGRAVPVMQLHFLPDASFWPVVAAIVSGPASA